MKIWKATKEDIPRIAQQMQELFLYHKKIDDMYLVPDTNKLINSLGKNLERDEFITICCESGFIRGRIVFGEKKEPYALLLDVYTEESFQRKGLGSLLFDEFKKWVMEKNINSIELFVDIRNKKSMSFWNKKGFKVFEERRRLII